MFCLPHLYQYPPRHFSKVSATVSSFLLSFPSGNISSTFCHYIIYADFFSSRPFSNSLVLSYWSAGVSGNIKTLSHNT